MIHPNRQSVNTDPTMADATADVTVTGPSETAYDETGIDFPEIRIPATYQRQVAMILCDRVNSGDEIDTDGRTLMLRYAATVAHRAVIELGSGCCADELVERILHVTYGPAEHRNRKLAAALELALNQSKYPETAASLAVAPPVYVHPVHRSQDLINGAYDDIAGIMDAVNAMGLGSVIIGSEVVRGGRVAR